MGILFEAFKGLEEFQKFIEALEKLINFIIETEEAFQLRGAKVKMFGTAWAPGASKNRDDAVSGLNLLARRIEEIVPGFDSDRSRRALYEQMEAYVRAQRLQKKDRSSNPTTQGVRHDS